MTSKKSIEIKTNSNPSGKKSLERLHPGSFLDQNPEFGQQSKITVSLDTLKRRFRTAIAYRPENVFRKAPPRNHNFVLSIEAIKGSALLLDFSQSKFLSYFKMKIFAAISSFGAVLGDDNLNLGVDPLKKSIFLKVE